MELQIPSSNTNLPILKNLSTPFNNIALNTKRYYKTALPGGTMNNMTLEDFDGKRLRKSVMRKTVDYNAAIIKELENRIWQRDYRDRRALQPHAIYCPDLMPPPSYTDNPITCVTTRFVKTATNKMRCPVFCMAWTPEGRRLITGASSGEFTLWNGLTFNFETILQAHDSPVRTMVWSHNENWMVTGDHSGYVKYWQSNMNNVKMFQAHKEALRGISFSPSDNKFVTCSDDGTLRIWDFLHYQEEKVLRGHGADVKCVHWHPQKALIISGSKDNQQPIKLWDPKAGQSLATLHAHKSTVMDLKWNDNGNWLITASRDHLLKLFDLRNLNQEVQTFRGHKKEASSVVWHPIHEGLFASGGSDGAIMFWHVGTDKEVGAIEQAHDSIVWTLAWHPLGHILCSGSNDHTSKFWTRNRPGDQMRDKYNLNTLPAGIAGLEDIDISEEHNSVIPGMGPEDKVELTALFGDDDNTTIPGLDLDSGLLSNEDRPKMKKVPFSKPIPRNFQAQWNDINAPEDGINDVLSKIVENTPGAVPLEKINPNAIIVYGKLIPVEPGSMLEKAISDGPEALKKYVDSGEIEELQDVIPLRDPNDEDNIDDYMAFYNYDDIKDMKSGAEGDNQYYDDNLSTNLNPEVRSFHPKEDYEMRSYGDTDLRRQELDFQPPSDFDMRKANTFGIQSGGPISPNHLNSSRGLDIVSGTIRAGARLIQSQRGSNIGETSRSLAVQRHGNMESRNLFSRDGNNEFPCGDEYGNDEYRNEKYNNEYYDDNNFQEYQGSDSEFYDEEYKEKNFNSNWQRNGMFNNFRGNRGNFRSHYAAAASMTQQPQFKNFHPESNNWNNMHNQQDFHVRGRSRGRSGQMRGSSRKPFRGRGGRGRGN